MVKRKQEVINQSIITPSNKTDSFPNSVITDKHLRFFHKYGFMIIRGLHTEEQTKKAKEGADYLIQQYKETYDGGKKGEHAF